MSRTALNSLLLNYVILGGIILLMGRWLINDSEFWAGLVILAAVPLAVAVVPFSYILGANTVFSLTGFITTCQAALISVYVLKDFYR